MLKPFIPKNDRTARIVIILLSVIVFVTVTLLSRIKVDVELGFDKHLFAKFNAMVNAIVSVLLIVGLLAVKKKNFLMHKRIMMTAIILSCLFLLSYICHHLFTGETKFGGQGMIRFVYFIILVTHILLAAIILPFILFTFYRAAVAEFPAHRKLALITWPIWLYVSITGVIVYLMISPYYT
jgi:putative membrane protein